MSFYRGLDNELHRLPERQLDPPEVEPPTDDELREAKARVLRECGPEMISNLLSEACGPDAWSQSPQGYSEQIIEGMLWSLLITPIQNGEHPEYGVFEDEVIGRVIRINAADYINEWAEKEAWLRGYV